MTFMARPLANPVLTPGTTADDAEIIAVINAETQCFAQADFDGWANAWLHDARSHMVLTSSIGQSVLQGWDTVAAHTTHALVHGGGCGMIRFDQTNFQISVEGNTAWVTFDQTAEDKDGGTWDSFETRVLERINGQWKIVYLSFVEKHFNRLAEGALCVDAKGHIVWASPDTLIALKDHPHLTVSAGRIRARNSIWDRTLQTAIAGTGRYHDFFDQWRFTQENGRPFHCPVVLGEADDGSVVVVQLSVRASSTYLLFDGEGTLNRRLAVAQTVFGLSDGQERVARYITSGVGVKGAAEALGISINTARTHLTRLYEKTGVNSQPALVRLLLSVG